MAHAFFGNYSYCSLMDFGDYLNAAYIGYLRFKDKKDDIKNKDAYMWIVIRGEILNEIHRFNGKKKRTKKKNGIIIETKWELPEYYDDFDFNMLYDEIDIEKEFISQEKIELLICLIEKLNYREQFVIKQSFLNNKQHKEIGASLNLKKTSLTNIKKSALESLKQYFEEIYD